MRPVAHGTRARRPAASRAPTCASFARASAAARARLARAERPRPYRAPVVLPPSARAGLIRDPAVGARRRAREVARGSVPGAYRPGAATGTRVTTETRAASRPKPGDACTARSRAPTFPRCAGAGSGRPTIAIPATAAPAAAPSRPRASKREPARIANHPLPPALEAARAHQVASTEPRAITATRVPSPPKPGDACSAVRRGSTFPRCAGAASGRPTTAIPPTASRVVAATRRPAHNSPLADAVRTRLP
jgi:translation initiation factor IF-2